MAVDLRVPALGESISTAQVGKWLKGEGEAVARDEGIVEVESEKATVVVPAPGSGVLRKILKQTGETVAIGEVLGEIEPGVPARPEPQATATPPPAKPPALPTPAPSPANAAAAEEVGRSDPVRLTPAARRALAERGLGKGDVLRLLDSGAARAEKALGQPALAGERERVVPMSPLRRTVARRLLEAQENAAILTTFNEVDMSRVLELREHFGPAFQEKHGVKLGFMSFFVKASVEALLAYPVVNAEVRGEDIVYKDHYDIGVAVGGGKGLVVPIIRDADQLSFAQIELTIAELAKRARENRVTMEDLSGGTFTISNGGIYGSLLSTPILNPPQSAILGLHKIQKRPAAGPDDQVVLRPMMYLALSYDHRIVDGREAVSFLVRIKELLEDPDRILLEV